MLCILLHVKPTWFLRESSLLHNVLVADLASLELAHIRWQWKLKG